MPEAIGPHLEILQRQRKIVHIDRILYSHRDSLRIPFRDAQAEQSWTGFEGRNAAAANTAGCVAPQPLSPDGFHRI